MANNTIISLKTNHLGRIGRNPSPIRVIIVDHVVNAAAIPIELLVRRDNKQWTAPVLTKTRRGYGAIYRTGDVQRPKEPCIPKMAAIAETKTNSFRKFKASNRVSS